MVKFSSILSFTCIGTLGILLLGEGFLPVAAPAQQCNPVGRIVEGSGGNFTTGQIVCVGDELQDANQARMLCFNNRSVIRFRGAKALVDQETCRVEDGAEVATQPCGDGQDTQCFRPKGSQTSFQVLEPEQTTLSEDRPRISWEVIPTASQYSVRIVGNGVNWERTVTTTELVYPETEPGLQVGNAYQIVVVAYLPEQQRLTTSTVVNRVSPINASN